MYGNADDWDVIRDNHCTSLRLDEGDFVAEKQSLMHILDQYQTILGFFHLPPCAARAKSDILCTRSPERVERRSLKTGSWKLKRITTRITRSDGRRSILGEENFLLSVYGRTMDALASGGDEGRGRLR